MSRNQSFRRPPTPPSNPSLNTGQSGRKVLITDSYLGLVVRTRALGLQDPHGDCQLLPVIRAPQLWPGQQQGLIALVPVVVLTIGMLLAVLVDGSLFVGRGFAGSANNRHTQFVAADESPLRPHPNRSDKYRFSV